MSHDSSSIKAEVYSDGKTHTLLKLLFFISVHKCRSSIIYITRQVLPTPTLIGTWFYEYH